jgi:hypothetical protein
MMKYLIMLLIVVGMIGCQKDSTSIESPILQDDILTDAVRAELHLPSKIASVILSPSPDPVGQSKPIYKDANYVFIARNYGPKGKQVPGLFVFSNKTRKWMEINRLSTKDARFGRSPTLEEGRCSVGWDYSGLREADYATIPLRTSGSLNFPDKILYQTDTSVYLLQFNSSWNIEAVLTQFIVKKDDLDKAFENEGEKLPQPMDAVGGTSRETTVRPVQTRPANTSIIELKEDFSASEFKLAVVGKWKSVFTYKNKRNIRNALSPLF